MKSKPSPNPSHENGSAAPATQAHASPAARVPKRSEKRQGPRVVPGTREANKLALAILDVLAGARPPSEAAEAAGLSLPRYYQLEQRALEAIVRSCEPRPKGPPKNPERQAARLERQIQRLTQELSRHQALLRAAQRTIGLAPLAAPKPAGGETGAKKKRRRKPTVRALKAARNLRQALDAQDAAAANSLSPQASPSTSSSEHPGPALAGPSLVTGGSLP